MFNRTQGAEDRLPLDVRYRVDVPAREPPLTSARVEPLPGDGIAVSRTLARHPKLNEARARRANFINRVSKLQPRHREMLILRIGWDCRSEYEWAQHVGSVGRARDHGLDPVRIAEGADAPGWDPFERMILRAVDELYRDAVISDRTWAGLAERYDTEQLMSAVFTASSYRATSMVLNAFGVQLEPGNERFPQLPAASKRVLRTANRRRSASAAIRRPHACSGSASRRFVLLPASIAVQTDRAPRRATQGPATPGAGREARRRRPSFEPPGVIRICKASGPVRR